MARVIKTTVAATELVLVMPALIFFAAIFLRNFFPTDDNGAQQIVIWFASRTWTLWILLVGLPMGVMALGFPILINGWYNDPSLREDTSHALGAVRAHLTMFVIGSATLAAAIFLVLVALHMLLN
jgi:hypothetical protein